jgi:hypothetical protein
MATTATADEDIKGESPRLKALSRINGGAYY